MSHTTWLHSHLDTDNDVSSEIKDMVKEKGSTCVSIIVPTHRLGQDRQADIKEVQRAILVAKESVSSEEEKILSGIDDLFAQIDFTREKDGIGIFVSPHIKKLVKFPFTVTKKIIVNKLFHLHDLLYLENYSTAYCLLDISKKEIRLFRGIMDHLEEIKDENFPKEITDDYEYSRPSQSSSNSGYAHVKGFEKDKSEVQQLRLKRIFRDTDKCLVKYLTTKEIPLLLCAAEREISLFKSVTNHLDNIAGLIANNQQRTSMHDMEVSAWDQLKSFIDLQKLKSVDEFKEKIGTGLAVYGVEEVWRAAKEGKAFRMLVEKEYNRSAFVTQEVDTVNEIMSTVLEKNGKIIIVEKDDLKDFKRIALINRY
ncbi:MAG TPA: hypothetical protein VFH08_03480 [Chitinophagaceae bacterium]|nr:hypothetical protein [Chitinophagaceae bacterium]